MTAKKPLRNTHPSISRQMTVYIPVDLKARLDRYCERTGIKMRSFVSRAVEKHLDAEEAREEKG